MSSRTRLPERESEFTWEEPYRSGGGGGGGSRSTGAGRGAGPRKVALPLVGVALLAGLFIGFMVGGSGGSTTVTQTNTVTEAAAPTGPTASGPGSRATMSLAVLNGSGEDGLAARTAEQLQGMGYSEVTQGNAPSRVTADRVYYRPGAEANALQVASDLGAAAPIALADNSGIATAAPDSDVIVVKGPSSAGANGAAAGDGATLGENSATEETAAAIVPDTSPSEAPTETPTP